MANELISRIENEIGLIDRLFSSYDDLLTRCQQPPAPNAVEIAAVAAVLQSFYLGIENISLMVAKNLDEGVPRGANWHQELLAQMTMATQRRKPLITPETRDILADYLGFRHVARHSYSFFLDWDEMAHLIVMLPSAWMQAKSEFHAFALSLRSGDKPETPSS